MQLPHNLELPVRLSGLFSLNDILNVAGERKCLKNAVTVKISSPFSFLEDATWKLISHSCLKSGLFFHLLVHIYMILLVLRSLGWPAWTMPVRRGFSSQRVCAPASVVWEPSSGSRGSLQWGDSIIGWAKTHRAEERGQGGRGLHISWQFQIKIQYMMVFQYPIILMNKEIFCTEICPQSPLD